MPNEHKGACEGNKASDDASVWDGRVATTGAVMTASHKTILRPGTLPRPDNDVPTAAP